jgi:F-type H+-transporting ATPase subunit delta
MASVGEREREIGRLYAAVMLRVAEEQGQAEALEEELAALVSHLDRNPEFQQFLTSPLIQEGPHVEVIEKAFRGRASDLLVDSLQVIGRKGRLGSLRAVATEYRKALRHLRGGMDVHIRTAVPLTDALRARLTDAITAAVDRKPTLIEHVDPSLVAGVVIELEGRKVDASLASRLHQLTEALLARASREIQSGKAYVAES